MRGGVGVSSDKCITTTGARRSKGHTNPANLANLAERGKSWSSLHLLTVKLIKILMKTNYPKLCRLKGSPNSKYVVYVTACVHVYRELGISI